MIQKVYREFALRWFENEPELIAQLYQEITNEETFPSFDTPTNKARLTTIQTWWNNNLPRLLETLNDTERLALDIVIKNFGWLCYDTLDNLLRLTSSILQIDRAILQEGFQGLCEKKFLFNYEPLTHYCFLFLSPFIELQSTHEALDEDLASYIYDTLPQVIGLLAYLVAYTPRSSEANEIHRIDFHKLQNFFEHTLSPGKIDNLLKNLSHIGIIQKYNNRILVQKGIVDELRNLSLSSLLALTFLYETLEKLEFQKSFFLTLQWLASSRSELLSLRDVFFFFLQHVLAFLPRNNIKSLKLFLQKEEQNFLLFIKQLEKQNIILIQRSHPLQISRQDKLSLNPFYKSLLRQEDFSRFFEKTKFIIETNGEIIVEPDLHPSIHLELIFIAEPVEVHTVAIYRITKKSIYKALAYGYTVENIIAFLEKYSLHPLSSQVKQNIQRYGEHYAHPIESHCHILQFPSTKSSLITDHFSHESIEIEPHTFLFFDDKSFQAVKIFCQKNDISFKENINFLQQSIIPYPHSLKHHIKHLQRFLDILESQSLFLPQQDILKIRTLTVIDFFALSREKPEKH